MNLGASRPAAHGDYYAWGEVEPYYSNLNPLTWKVGKEGGYAWSSYKWCEGRENTLTKYCNDSNYGYNGFTDYLTELEPEDDAAYVKLGGYWRMPTRPELVELYNCTWVYTTIDGVTGYKVTGSNSNSIFLPLNLPWHRDGKRDTVRGSYWGSTGYSLFSSGIGFFMPPYDDMSDSGYPRYYGLSIRPVYDEPDSKPRIHASPTAINYGDVKVGEGLGNATGRVTFTNTGGSDLSISKFDCPDGFSHSSAYSFPIVIPPGSDKTIVFAFKPTEAKTYSGDVIVYSNASNGGCEIRVTGRGIE